jgi:hypothetical protein
LNNVTSCAPISEEESAQYFSKAEALLGTPEWLPFAQETGVKFKTTAEAGAAHHGLAGDATQNAWSRIDMGSMHFLGIVDNNFREFLLHFVSAAARRRLSTSPYALRQPPGTKALSSYVTIDKKDNSAKFSAAGEKLHQKKKWRKTLMLYDLKRLFKGDDEKNVKINRVSSNIRSLV